MAESSGRRQLWRLFKSFVKGDNLRVRVSSCECRRATLTRSIEWRQTMVRVNVCCLNSVVFFVGTWLVFYAVVLALFCAVLFAAATALLGL